MIPDWAVQRWKKQREREQQKFERDVFELGREPMSRERKIVVPSDMATAANNAVFDAGMPMNKRYTRVAVEAALGWLSKNPLLPSMEQAHELRKLGENTSEKYQTMTHTCASVVAVVAEWQRRMFLAPPDEVPTEVKDLLEDPYMKKWGDKKLQELVLEAFRRGQRAQEKR